MNKDQNVLETILKAVVMHPEEVRVERSHDDMGILLTVSLGNGDAGRVIGKKGDLIDAIRRVIRSVGRLDNARVNVKLNVPERPRS